MVLNLMSKVGWEPQSTDGHLTTLLRGVMIGLVSTFAYDDNVVAKEAATRFAAFQKDANDVQSLPSDMRTSVFKIVLKNGGQEEYDAVKSYFFTADTQAERKHVMNSLGSTLDPNLKLATMEWSTSGEVKLQDFFYLMGSVGRSKGGTEISWKYYQDSFVRIKGMLGKASSSLMDSCIVCCAGAFTSNEKADEIQAFFEEHPLPSNTRIIAQTVENMRTNAKLVERLKASDLSRDDFWSSL
jgi:puromycin-sensitive aminopeptidase